MKNGQRFLDAWGGLWEVCRPDDAGAVAFGPAGAARELRYSREAVRQALPPNEYGWCLVPTRPRSKGWQ